MQKYALENAKYANAGQKSINYKFEDTVVKYSDQYPEFKSKYIVSWEEYKKLYPPVNDLADVLMKQQYEKYVRMVPSFVR